jgi:predicted N-acetyltransferase YhbS
MSLIIREEKPSDYAAVEALIAEAFAKAEHADGNEAALVAALRRSDAFRPALSLVAEADGELAGHILFTVARVGSKEALALAPLAVKPAFQRRGIGSALVRRGHEAAARLGFGWSVVLGDPGYYGRFGYRPAALFGIEAPAGIPAEYLMALKLRADAPALSGTLRYADAFGL